MSYTPDLPNELWKLILRLASVSSLTSQNWCLDYQPFMNISFPQPLVEMESDRMLKARWSLCLVCRTWCDIALPFLYEDVHLGPSANSLWSTLRFSSKGRDPSSGYGKWVRRIELVPFPEEYNFDSCRLPNLVQILEWCPNLEVFSTLRMIDSSYPPHFWKGVDSDSFLLPTLKRLDWAKSLSDCVEESITLLLRKAPYLEHLSLSYRYKGGESITARAPTDPPLCPSLRVLRINCMFRDTFTKWHLREKDLPSLTHLVSHPYVIAGTDTFPSSPAIKRLTSVLELTPAHNFGFAAVHRMTREFPNLQVLNLCIPSHHFPISPFGHNHPRIETVGVFRRFSIEPEVVDQWILKETRGGLCAGIYPNLKRVILYGEWDPAMLDTKIMHEFRYVVRKQLRCELELQDGTQIDCGVLRVRKSGVE